MLVSLIAMTNRKPVYNITIFILTATVLAATFFLLSEQQRLVQDNLGAQSRAEAAEATAVVALNQRATAENLAQSGMGTIEAQRSHGELVEIEATSVAALATTDAAAYAAQAAVSIPQDQEMLAYQLALESQVLLNEQPNQFEKSVLLAIEAAKRFPTVGTVQALKDVLALLPRHEKRISFDHSISDFVYSPNNGYMAISDYDNKTVQIYDVQRAYVVSSFSYDASIDDLIFSATGKYIAGKERNNTIIVWDVVTGTEIARYETEHQILHFSISPNDKYFGLATSGAIQFWELTTGKEIASWSNVNAQGGFSFSVDGEAVYFNDNGVYRWEIATGINEILVDEVSFVLHTVFSPQNNYLFQADYGTDNEWRERIFSLTTGNIITLTQPIPDNYDKVVFSPDERYLVSKSSEGSLVGRTYGIDSVQVWDVVSGQSVMIIEDFAYDLAFSPDSRYLAVAFSDNLRVWDTENWQEVKRIGSDDRIVEIAYSLDGHQLITVQPGWQSKKSQIDVWDMNMPQIGLRIRHLTQPREISDFAFTPDSQILATGGTDWTVHLWNTIDGSEISTFDHGDEVITIAISPDGKYLLSGGQRNSYQSESLNEVRLWDLATGNQVFTTTPNITFNSSFSPDGLCFTRTSGYGTQVYEVDSGNEIIFIPDVGREDTLYNFDGQYVALLGYYGFEIWDTVTWQRIMVDNVHVGGIRFSPDNQHFGSYDRFGNVVKIREILTGNEVMAISHDEGVEDIDFSADGRFLAIGRGNNNTGTVQVWDMINQQMFIEMKQEGPVENLVFSPDGRYLAFTVRDKNWKDTVSIWDMAINREVNRLGHRSFVSEMLFSPDGRQLLTTSGVTAVYLWLWNPDDLIAEACDRLPRNLTQEEWQLYFGSEPYQPTCPNLPIE